ncbi:MAG: S8 family serine peptidase [Thermoleophilia bacterium]
MEHRGADGAWTAVAASQATGAVSVATPPSRPSTTAPTGPSCARTPVPQLLELVSGSANLDGAVADGSVLTPGDARGAPTVGAVPWQSRSLAPYSSKGPTEDGRVKPDVSGPTYVTANPGFPGTAGTSAATAHVAGAAVLLRARRLAQGLPAAVGDLRGALVAGAWTWAPPARTQGTVRGWCGWI